jgi:hypothetical protein
MLQVGATGMEEEEEEEEEEEDLNWATFFAVAVKFGQVRQNGEMDPSAYTVSCLTRRPLNGLRLNLE